MRAYEPKGAVGEADAVPENPLAQNAATEALKPKARAVPAVGATLDDPNAPALPGVQPSTAAPMVNIDPNAYAPPPQAAEPAVTAPTPLPTLSGDWQAPTASAQSAPLIASAAGGTMTPQGDATNLFRGYETDQGGKFGGYDSVPLANDPSGRTFKQYDQDFVKNANALKQVPPLSREEFAAMTAQDSGANAVKDKIARGQPVSDKELAFVRQARGMELGQDTAAPTFGTFGTKAGTTTAADPTEQARLLAGQAAGTVPSGPAVPAPELPSLNPSGLTPSGKDPRQEWVQQQMAGVKPDFGGAAPVGGPEAAVFKPNILTTLAGGQNTTGGLPVPAPSGAQPPTASGMGNVAQTAVTPENALTNALLSRAPGADRFKIAQEQADAAAAAGQPQYEADLRQAMRKAAAGGALGSGMLQTSIGDIAQNRDIFNRANRTNLLSEALKGNIEDQFRDVGVAQQQQGFQQGQQQQAFGNEVTRAGLEEALTSGSFQRALQQLTAGSGGNPADTALLLSQIFGGQASEAGSSLAQLLAGLGQKSTSGAPASGGGSNALQDYLLSTLFGTGKQVPIASAPTTYQRPDTLPFVPEDRTGG